MIKKNFITIGLLIIVSGCGSTEKELQKMPDSLVGTWEQRGYGQWLDIDASGFTLYETTQNSCIQSLSGTFEDWQQIILKSEANSSTLSIDQTTVASYTLDKRDALPENCAQGVINTPTNNFQILWDTFNENYAFFDERNVDWQDQYTKYSPQIEDSMGLNAWFVVVAEMLEPLHDAHVTLWNADRGLWQNSAILPSFIQHIIDTCSLENNPGVCMQEARTKLDTITYSYLDTSESFLNQQLEFGKIKTKPHVAYFNLKSMEGYNSTPSAQVGGLDMMDMEDPKRIDTFMQTWTAENPDITTVIIDLRFNGGGQDENSMTWASWLVNETKEVITRKAKYGDGFTQPTTITIEPRESAFDGKIIILTSKYTVSAAETFLLAMQSYDHVHIVGEQTQGAFSDMLEKNLPNGFQFSLSNEVFSDMDGMVYEASGIPVNVEMQSYSESELNDNRDLVLEQAILLSD